LEYLDWLVPDDTQPTTTDGNSIEIYEIRHQADDSAIAELASHLRNQYCLDEEIDDLCSGTGYSRKEYLLNLKFPDEKVAPGPSIRAGDFSEILVADYLECKLDNWVPRTRYCDKAIRNESTKGCDIIGIKIVTPGQDSENDTLTLFESKAKLTGNDVVNKLQEAIDDSGKDILRKAESLNAIKQRFLRSGNNNSSDKIERFQNKVDRPFTEISGAAAVFSLKNYDAKSISNSDASNHPNRNRLQLIVFFGDELMEFVHSVYGRAADEA